MAVKAWFDYETYMSNKLNQMVKAEPQAGWTADSLKTAFEKAGFYGDTGAQEHFLKWGHKEDVSPNKMFDANYYYQAKALAYYTSTEAGSAQVAKEVVLADLAGYGDKMEAIIKGAGMDAWTHYTKYGTKEGINPSNDFDTSNYMAAKIAAMNGTMTADEVYAAFKKAGMNALAHAEMYAGKGGQETAAAANTFVVPEDEQLPTGDGDGTALTVNIDNLSGTHFTSDPFVNSLGDVKQTLNTGDTLKGTGEDNSLDVTWSAQTDNGSTMNNGTIVTPTMSNIQTLNMTNIGGTPLTINGKNVTDLTTVNVADSTQNFTIHSLATKVENVSITSTDTDTKVQMQDSALTGTEDALALTVNGLKQGASFETSKGYESLTVTTTGSDSAIDQIVANGATKLTIAGDKGLTLRGYVYDTENSVNTAAVAPLNDSFTEIDASALTGNFVLGGKNATLGSGAFASKNTESVKITGGSGTDTFYIADLNAKYTIDGGESDGDTLYVVGANGTDANPYGFTKAPTIKNVEKLGVMQGDGTGVTSNVDMNLKGVAGLNELILGNMGDQNSTITLRNMTHNADQDFVITAVGNGRDEAAATGQTFNAVTYTPYGTVSDKAHITMNVSNQGTADAYTLGTLNFGKVENVDLNVSDLATKENFSVDLSSSALETFNFSADGGKNIDLGTLGKGGSLKAVTIDSDAAVSATMSQTDGAVVTVHGKGSYDLKFTNVKNDVTVDSADAAGPVTITKVVSEALGATDVINLDGGNGVDTLGVTVDGVAGHVLAATNVVNFRGYAGNDTLNLTAAKDKVIFEATADDNGKDAISNLTFGAAGTDTDTLDFSAFLGTVKVLDGAGAAAAADTALTGITGGAAGGTDANGAVMLAANMTETAIQGLFGTASGTAGKLNLTSGQHAVVINSNAALAAATTADVYYVESDGTNITLTGVGTIASTDHFNTVDDGVFGV